MMFSPKKPPFIVAEISGNHHHSLDRAFELVEKAKEAGADAIKLQTYTPDTLTLNLDRGDFRITQKGNLWEGRTLYDLYKQAYTPWEWHKPLFERAKKLGLIAFSTPFDKTALDFLEELDVPCYKIASPEIVHLPLIRLAAATRKPLILSTGGASREEIQEAVETARGVGCRDLTLLKCTIAYPADPQECNLATLPDMAASFQTSVGLSDHTLGIGVALASIPLGACLIEKHLTLSRSDGAIDSPFSLEPHELKCLVEESRKAWQALGTIHYGPTPSEMTTHSHRPSIFFVKKMKSGDTVTSEHIQIARPASGLAPKHFEALLGRQVCRPVHYGDPVSWDCF